MAEQIWSIFFHFYSGIGKNDWNEQKFLHQIDVLSNFDWTTNCSYVFRWIVKVCWCMSWFWWCGWVGLVSTKQYYISSFLIMKMLTFVCWGILQNDNGCYLLKWFEINLSCPWTSRDWFGLMECSWSYSKKLMNFLL